MTELEQRQAIVDEAKSWLGTPYHHQANIKGVGVDCGMILIEVYAAVGLIEHFDPRPYPVDWHMHRDSERYLAEVLPRATEITIPPQAGDIVVCRYGRTFSHSGIMLDNHNLLHAFSVDGCVVLSDLDKPPFKKNG